MSPSGRFTDTRASVRLDLVRALAAFVVLVSHWRHLFFVNFPLLEAHRNVLLPFYLLANCGHQAVIVFFVMSGYLVGGSAWRAWTARRWSWTDYLTHRLVRLWTVLIPGLLLCCLCDRLGLASHTAPLLYSGQAGNYIVESSVAARGTLLNGLRNLFFLQTDASLTFGSDGALWSLANEFWYYLIFPCLALIVLGRSTWAKGLSLVLALTFCWIAGWQILKLSLIWLSGVALLRVRPRRIPGWLQISVYCLYLALFMGISSVRSHLVLCDYLLDLATVAFFVVLISDQQRHGAGWPVSAIRTAAGFSFTLYVVHTPVLVLCKALLAGDTFWQPTLRHIGPALACLGLVLGLAYALALGTEFKTDTIRRYVVSRLPTLVKPA